MAEDDYREVVEGAWSHYYSTYCIHRLHSQCRLTCKHCEAPCQCRCHPPAQIDGGQTDG